MVKLPPDTQCAGSEHGYRGDERCTQHSICTMQQFAMATGRIDTYLRLTRLNRPIGIFLVVWPMLWALWVAAGGVPNLWILVVFVVGAVLMRSAGCIINDFADRNIDGHVKRTRERPLATGEMGSGEALGLFTVM